MIRFEAFNAAGDRVVVNEWRDSEVRQLAAYRMRWLRSGRYSVRVTGADGSVREYNKS